MNLIKYRDKAGEFRWHLKVDHGEIICHSEGHADERNRNHSLDLVRNLALTRVSVINKDNDPEYP